MESVRDKLGQLQRQARRGRGQLKAGKEVGDEFDAQARYGLVAVERVRLPGTDAANWGF